jgi:hypothetical protein
MLVALIDATHSLSMLILPLAIAAGVENLEQHEGKQRAKVNRVEVAHDFALGVPWQLAGRRLIWENNSTLAAVASRKNDRPSTLHFAQCLSGSPGTHS